MALDCGITCQTFWELSLTEIGDCIESHARVKRNKIRQQLSGLHFLARDIATQISCSMNSDAGESPQLWDYFPELFAEEKKAAKKEIQEQKLAVYKAQMSDFAYRYNYARTGGES